MGRKPRDPKPRKRYTRDPYDRVLIVCEGARTEPNYFKGLRDHLRIHSANIEIVGAGATPSKIIERAEVLADQAERGGNPFDKVYCVFDKDEHTDYKKALQSKHFENIPSVPCFEYWILLHYTYTTGTYKGTRGRRQLVSDIRRFHSDYEKGKDKIYEAVKDKTETAKKHAQRSLKAARQAGTDNPSTHVHILVDYLQNIKNR